MKYNFKIIFVLPLLVSTNIYSQDQLDASKLLLQEKQKELAPKASESDIKLPILKPIQKRELIDTGIKADVKKFIIISDTTVFTKEQIKKKTTKYLNKKHDINDLYNALDDIKELYKSKGYFLIKTYFPQQDISSGIVKIKVIEGKLDKVIYNFNKAKINTSYIKDIVNKYLKTNKAFKKEKYEKLINTLNSLAGITAKLSLKTGEKEDSVIIAVDIKQEKTFHASFNIDNTGSRYTGVYKSSLNTSFKNISNYGDNLNVTLSKSLKEGDMQMILADYSFLPFYSPTKLGINTSYLSYKLGDSLENLNAYGKALSYSLYINFPKSKIASLNYNIKSALNIANTKDHASGSLSNKKKVTTFKNTLHLDYSDRVLKGAYSYIDLSIHHGFNKLLLDTQKTADMASSGANSYGRFSKLSYTTSRIQRITDNFTVNFSSSAQYANKNLDSSQKFQLGGLYGVRAYPMGEASGDNGIKATLQTKYKLLNQSSFGSISLTTFYDWGRVQLNKDKRDMVITTPNIYNLSGYGVGILANNDNHNLSLQVASKIGNNQGASQLTGNDSDGYNKKYRIWISFNKSF